MRVIGGRARRQALELPPVSATRPFLEMARGALFNALGDRVEGARVLDAYAGSGALGIEALSRGAREAVFVEADRRAVQTLRGNLARCGLEASAVLREGTVESVMGRLAAEPGFDLMFLDPPFSLAEAWGREGPGAWAGALAASLAADGVLILRLEKKSGVPALPGLGMTRDREYGRSRLVWYAPPD